MNHRDNATLRQRQRGAALVVSLVFLLVMTLIGVTAMQSTTQQESMASNARQRNLAFQAAEAGIRAGEAILQQPALPTFNNSTPGITRTGLLSAFTPDDPVTYWVNNYPWPTGSQPLTGNDVLEEVTAQPRYVVEQLPLIPIQPGPGESIAAGKPLPEDQLYRVTARGIGGVADAVVVLQTTFRR